MGSSQITGKSEVNRRATVSKEAREKFLDNLGNIAGEPSGWVTAAAKR